MPLSIRLDKELYARYTMLSEVTGKPISYYAKKALAESIDDIEELYYSIHAAERIKKGLAQSVSFEELNRLHEQQNKKQIKFKN